MTQLTLEALAVRVAVLEQKVAELSAKPSVTLTAQSGTGDWDAAAQAARQLREAGSYDFDAAREQREFDRQHAEDHLR